MEPLRGIVGRDDRQVRRQAVADRKGYAAGRDGTRGSNGGHLPAGVDAGVRAAGAGGTERVPENAPQGVLKFLLNGAQSRLALPAVEICAVVGENEPEGTLHERGSYPRVRKVSGAARSGRVS